MICNDIHGHVRQGNEMLWRLLPWLSRVLSSRRDSFHRRTSQTLLQARSLDERGGQRAVYLISPPNNPSVFLVVNGYFRHKQTSANLRGFGLACKNVLWRKSCGIKLKERTKWQRKYLFLVICPFKFQSILCGCFALCVFDSCISSVLISAHRLNLKTSCKWGGCRWINGEIVCFNSKASQARRVTAEGPQTTTTSALQRFTFNYSQWLNYSDD